MPSRQTFLELHCGHRGLAEFSGLDLQVQGLEFLPKMQSGDFASAVSPAIPSHLPTLKLEGHLLSLKNNRQDFFSVSNSVRIAFSFKLDEQTFDFVYLWIC